MEPGLQLSIDMSPKSEEEKSHMKNVWYLAAVGSIMYLATTTRPDIAYTAGTLTRFGSNPGVAHWNAVKHLLCTYKEQQTTHSPTVWITHQENSSWPSQMLTTVDAGTADH